MAVSILAIDPGRSTGWAYYHSAQLHACGVMLQSPANSISIVQHYRPEQVVCEIPQVYMPAQSKGDPNDLIGLFKQCGWFEMAGHLEALKVITVLPNQWKGQLPKNVCHNRSRKVLSEVELGKISGKDHNMWDAVGLGLWYLKRRRR